MAGAALGLIPSNIRSLIGALVALPCRFYQWRINRALKNYYISSLPFLKTPPNENPKETRDHFQQMLRFAQKERPKELNIHDIGTRLLIANFGTFHPTAILATNPILKVLDSNPEYNTISILRSEISKVLAESNGVWSRTAIAKMIRCDSVLRETLRINAYRARNMMRKVMVNNLKTEDGIVLPKGSDISSSPSPFKLTASCSMTPSSSILSAILAFVNQVLPTLPTSKRNPMTIKARLRISALFPRVLNICRLVMASTLVLEDTSLISSSR
jgi:hypothetical protein